MYALIAFSHQTPPRKAGVEETSPQEDGEGETAIEYMKVHVIINRRAKGPSGCIGTSRGSNKGNDFINK